MVTNTQLQQRPGPAVDARGLWTGGVATSVVAALVAVVGVLIVRGVFGVPVMAPGNADYVGAVGLAVFAAVGGLLATALAHVLLLFAPRPMAFFGWIAGLVTVVFAIWPATVGAGVAGHFANAVLYTVIGVAIDTLVGRTARQAVRPR
jgi:hypothetical protein